MAGAGDGGDAVGQMIEMDEDYIYDMYRAVLCV